MEMRWALALVLSLALNGYAQGFNWLETLPGCVESGHFAQSLSREVQGFLQAIHQSKRVWAWTMQTRNLRYPHYCESECACLRQEIAARLHESPMSAQIDGIWGLDIRHGDGGLLPVELKISKDSLAYFNYHQSILLRARENGCYVIIDPILAREKPLTPEDWVNHVASCDDNDLRVWQIFHPSRSRSKVMTAPKQVD